MKRILLIALCAVCISHAFGQDAEGENTDKKWILKGTTGLNFTQTHLSNWSAGGESSYAGNIYLNGNLNHKFGNWLWENILILDYGLTRNKTNGVQKTSDKIDFSTKLGYSTDNKWFYTAMAGFNSQFYKGYNYPNKENYISKFMAPGYLNTSLGIEYRAKDRYSVYLSPVAGKMTFVNDDYLSNIEGGSFGVDQGKHFRAEFGASLKARAEQPIMENVKAVSTLELFTAYNESFGNVDIDWDLMITMKINKVLSASINTTLKYDDDIKTFEGPKVEGGEPVQRGPKVQFREILGLGVAYTF